MVQTCFADNQFDKDHTCIEWFSRPNHVMTWSNNKQQKQQFFFCFQQQTKTHWWHEENQNSYNCTIVENTLNISSSKLPCKVINSHHCTRCGANWAFIPGSVTYTKEFSVLSKLDHWVTKTINIFTLASLAPSENEHAKKDIAGAYNATKRNAAVCMMMAPSPAGFDVFRHLAENQFSWIDVTTSVQPIKNL